MTNKCLWLRGTNIDRRRRANQRDQDGESEWERQAMKDKREWDKCRYRAADEEEMTNFMIDSFILIRQPNTPANYSAEIDRIDCEKSKHERSTPMDHWKYEKKEEEKKRKTKIGGKKNWRNANEWTERVTNAPATEKFHSTARIHFASGRARATSPESAHQNVQIDVQRARFRLNMY